MINVDKIEDLICDYITVNGCAPKYILLDKTAHDEFSRSFHPKEKVSGQKPEYLAIVSWQSSYSTKEIGILSVDTHKTIFEAVR